MLEALGPKYPSTADCFMRTLQAYGLEVGQLLDDEFQWASVERGGIPIPLLDLIEGITSDAGGEVQFLGGKAVEFLSCLTSWRRGTTAPTTA